MKKILIVAVLLVGLQADWSDMKVDTTKELELMKQNKVATCKRYITKAMTYRDTMGTSVREIEILTHYKRLVMVHCAPLVGCSTNCRVK